MAEKKFSGGDGEGGGSNLFYCENNGGKPLKLRSNELFRHNDLVVVDGARGGGGEVNNKNQKSNIRT